jgi:hypothetical protein
MDMSNPKVRKLYHDAKDRAFDWDISRLEEEIDQLDSAKPTSARVARGMEITLQAYEDALSERELAGERTYHDEGPPDSPSLDGDRVPPK